MWSDRAIALMREYMGTGLILTWFLLAMVYLFVKEERKQVRILFLYVPAILLLLFFNPLFFRAMEKYVGNEIYYRILWLLPVTVVIAYAAAVICGGLKGKKRLLLAAVMACLIAVSGKNVYDNAFFVKAENLYHVPDSVVHICDAIQIEGREVTAVFPPELVQYVRQYSPVICMPYGREILVTGWSGWDPQNDLCDALEADEPDAGTLGALAREEQCVYIVISAEKKIKGSLQDQGYGFWGEIDGYAVYKDLYFQPGF